MTNNSRIILNLNDSTTPFNKALAEAIKERTSKSLRLQKDAHVAIYTSKESQGENPILHAVYLSDADNSENIQKFDAEKDTPLILENAVKRGHVTVYTPCTCGCTGHELMFLTLKNQTWTYGICPP